MASVLIIDDDEHVTQLLQMHLSDEGYDVMVAARGNDGMAQALRSTPDLILLDVILPDVTGFQMCGQFRRTAATKQVPIIMITGSAKFPNQKQFAFERGANEYVLKPFRVFEMGELVNRYIGMKRRNPPAAPTTKGTLPLNPMPKEGPISELREYFQNHPQNKPGF